MRLRLHDEINQQGRAHIILRIGYGGKIKHVARRPLKACLKVSGKAYEPTTPKEKAAATSKKKKFWPFG